MTCPTRYLAIAAASAASLAAQWPDPAILTASNGIQVRQHLQQSPFAQNPARFEFLNSNGTCDVGHAHACYWRTNSLGMRQFSDTNQSTFVSTATSYTATWSTFNFIAVWTREIIAEGSSGAIVKSEWRFTNTRLTPINIEFVSYTDFDVDGTQDLVEVADPDFRYRMTSGAGSQSCGTVEFFGIAPDSFEIDYFPQTERRLASFSSFAGLESAGRRSTADDYTVALGWSLSLQGGESRTVCYSHALNATLCDNPAASTQYGPSLGMTLSTSNAPALGRAFQIDVSGPPSSPTTLFVGVAPISVPLFDCPQVVLVSPLAELGLGLDSNGFASLAFPPSCDTALCGTSLFLQAWSIDGAIPCLPLTHSNGLEIRFGF